MLLVGEVHTRLEHATGMQVHRRSPCERQAPPTRLHHVVVPCRRVQRLQRQVDADSRQVRLEDLGHARVFRGVCRIRELGVEATHTRITQQRFRFVGVEWITGRLPASYAIEEVGHGRTRGSPKPLSATSTIRLRLSA